MQRTALRQFRTVMFGLLMLAVMTLSFMTLNRFTAQAEFGTNWAGTFFSNPTLTDPVVYTENYATGINVNWGTGSPNAAVPNDNWSARFLSVQSFNAATYEFVIIADDGVRVFVDSVLQLDQFFARPLTPDTFQIALTAGSHTIHVEYLDVSGEAALQVQYYQIDNLTQTPTNTGTPFTPTATTTETATATATQIATETATATASATASATNTIPAFITNTASPTIVASFTSTHNGRLDICDPVFRRPNSIGQPTFSNVFYESFAFTVDQAGRYKLGMSVTTMYDGYFVLYQTSFDPLNPTVNFVISDDDDIDKRPVIQTDLQAGLRYILVTTTFSVEDTGTYTNIITGPGQVTPDPSNATTGCNPIGTVSGVLDTCDPLFDRPDDFDSLSGPAPYESFNFTVNTAGNYSFALGQNSLLTHDSFFALYSGTFNPASPLTNLIGFDDDSGYGALSLFDINLTPGAYILVVTSASSLNQLGAYTVEFGGSAPVTFGSNTATLNCGLCVLVSRSLIVGAEGSPLTYIYNVRLAQPPPDQNLVVTPLYDPAQITISPASRTLSYDTFERGRNFTVTIVDDALDEADPHLTSIAHAVSVQFNTPGCGNITVSIHDNDGAP